VHYDAFPLEAYNLDRAYLTLSGPRDGEDFIVREGYLPEIRNAPGGIYIFLKNHEDRKVYAFFPL
jgi:hypothetical protein